MILKAAWVLPISGPPIRDGFIEVEGDLIKGIGSAAALPVEAGDVVDLGEAALTPGLVNPHAHLELTCYAGMLGPGSLWDWLVELVRLRRRPGQMERERRGVIDGAWMSLRAGVTCVGDISRCNYAWPALKAAPIRKISFVEIITIADQSPRNVEELRSAAADVIEDALLTVGISPHAPYSVSGEHLEGALRLAEELERPWTMHLAETLEESAFLRGEAGALPPMIAELGRAHGLEAPRCRPVEFLEERRGVAGAGSLAHCNYLDDEQIALLAEAGHVVIYCPRSHAFYGHPEHPLPRLLKAGVATAIGTDSLASNKSLSMLDELHFVHTGVAGAPGPEQLLEMATIEGARALGLADRIGTLEVGKQADLAAFACPGDVVDPAAHLIESPGDAVGVWVRGERVIPSDASERVGNVD